jgi:hypothetical protein
MLILLAAWSGARWGELVALNRDRLNLDRGTLTIDRQYVELEDNSLVLDRPKSAAGIRTVHIPPHLLDELQEHLATYPDPAPERSLVFTNGEGRPLSRGGFRSTWVKARERVGLPTFRSTTCGTPATPWPPPPAPAPRSSWRGWDTRPCARRRSTSTPRPTGTPPSPPHSRGSRRGKRCLERGRTAVRRYVRKDGLVREVQPPERRVTRGPAFMSRRRR